MIVAVADRSPSAAMAHRSARVAILGWLFEGRRVVECIGVVVRTRTIGKGTGATRI